MATISCRYLLKKTVNKPYGSKFTFQIHKRHNLAMDVNIGLSEVERNGGKRRWFYVIREFH